MRFTCTARVEVANKLARYWTEFPRGPRVAQAVTISAARLSEFLETCNAARGAETGSREENWWAQVHWEPDGAETAREIRATLTAVREEDKAPLVELFDGLEACAAAVGAVPGGIHLRPDDVKWSGIREDCWIPESVVLPTQGVFLAEGDLLRIADRLLADPVDRPLDDWVAAVNLLDHRWYREMVGASAILIQRRSELLARALGVLESGNPFAPPLSDRDPLALAWAESLGGDMQNAEGLLERVVESGDAGSGRRAAETGRAAGSARNRHLAIIAFDVICRAEPSSAPTLRGATLPLDHHFTTERGDTTVAGQRWTEVWEGCWVLASNTAPGDADDHVVEITERFFAVQDHKSLDNVLRVYNVLTSARLGHPDALERTPLLRARRLDLLERWLGTFMRFTASPLTLGLVRSLEEEVRYFEPGGQWELRPDVYLGLYEELRGQPLAHDILWKFASRWPSHDCEGNFQCFAGAEVMNTGARYWVEFPRGPHVAEAVARAVDRLGHFLRGGRAARDAGPESRDAGSWQRVVWGESGAVAASEIRESLAEVGEVAREPLVTFLDELSACAAEMSAPAADRHQSCPAKTCARKSSRRSCRELVTPFNSPRISPSPVCKRVWPSRS